MSPEKFLDFRETGPWTHDCYTVPMTEFILGFSQASLILPSLSLIFCLNCMCNLLVDKRSVLCLFSSVVCSSSVASQRREGNLCCLGTQYCYQSLVCFCVCIIFFFFVKKLSLLVSLFLLSFHSLVHFLLPLLPYCIELCFLRGEVVAKADHTDQILYSEIGKLNIIQVYGSLTTQITLETEFQNSLCPFMLATIIIYYNYLK